MPRQQRNLVQFPRSPQTGRLNRVVRHASWVVITLSILTVAGLRASGGPDFGLPSFTPEVAPAPVQIAGAGDGQSIQGVASVIDGDTIEIHGTRIRLHGIDAPESAQTCQRSSGTEWRCGQQAALVLRDFIGRQTVTCEQRDIDRYGRVVARCSVSGTDINGWLVTRGWAVAYRHYSSDYVGEEQAAKAAGAGIWSGKFVMPWDWRRGERLKAKNESVGGDCQIKGNISSSGERIYHVPGGQYYAKTQIDAGRGERWFCTEEEARKGGWRKSKI